MLEIRDFSDSQCSDRGNCARVTREPRINYARRPLACYRKQINNLSSRNILPARTKLHSACRSSALHVLMITIYLTLKNHYGRLKYLCSPLSLASLPN